jgi:protein disulfide-isomerase A6
MQVKFGAVDCTVHQSTCGQYGVRGYPTIKVFGSNKDSPSEYQAGRDSGSIVAEANKAFASNAKPREVSRIPPFPSTPPFPP